MTLANSVMSLIQRSAQSFMKIFHKIIQSHLVDIIFLIHHMAIAATVQLELVNPEDGIAAMNLVQQGWSMVVSHHSRALQLGS